MTIDPPESPNLVIQATNVRARFIGIARMPSHGGRDVEDDGDPEAGDERQLHVLCRSSSCASSAGAGPTANSPAGAACAYGAPAPIDRGGSKA